MRTSSLSPFGSFRPSLISPPCFSFSLRYINRSLAEDLA